MKIRTLSFIFGLVIAISSSAQQSIPDSLKANAEICATDSLVNDDEDLPCDSLKTADETLYKNIWNCTQIKYPTYTLPNKNDTITISLIGANDHPFVNPVKGRVISKFGRRGRRIHTGTDIKLNSGDTVRCAFDGRVRLAKKFSGYGNLVLVRHSNGLETIYGHLKAIKVKVNDTIKAGDVIGLGGRTGRATCDHLHFETRLFGEPFDSNKYIDFEKFALRSDKIYYKNKRFEIDPENFKNKLAPEKAPVLASKTKTTKSKSTVSKSTTSAKGTTTASKSVASAKSAATKEALAAKSTPAKSNIAAAPTKSVPTKSVATKHVIRNGDSLWTIAKKYNTTVKRLCSVNRISGQKTLKIGSVLMIN